MSSNVSLHPEIYRFLKRGLVSMGYNGYFDVDWAGSAGSGRQFYRIFVGRNITLILMIWDGTDKDWDYFFEVAGLPFQETVLPKVYRYDKPLGVLLVADSGFRQLKDLFRGVFSYKDKSETIKEVFRKLKIFSSVDTSLAGLVGSRYYDTEHATWESEYFKEHVSNYLPDVANTFDEHWEREVNSVREGVMTLDRGLMHRDFQSENILIKEGDISYVDFQGARIGPVEYDIASLLFDPYIYNSIPDDLRSDLLNYSCFEFGIKLNNIYYAAIQRLMQAIGAYCNLSMNKGKKRYLRFVRPAVVGLHYIYERVPQYPSLASQAALILENITKR